MAQQIAKRKRKGVLYGGGFNIPVDIVNEVPEGTLFECEVVEEGILFRVVGKKGEMKQRPDWMK